LNDGHGPAAPVRHAVPARAGAQKPEHGADEHGDDPAALARKRDQPILAAVVAAKPREAARQPSTL
jgi:hypothetical protein